ncbi:MAG: PAS domain S-box protein, partial [Holophagales bacterium]|nr:PAS domain S-box protein [Holophagales bacterium]
MPGADPAVEGKPGAQELPRPTSSATAEELQRISDPPSSKAGFVPEIVGGESIAARPGAPEEPGSSPADDRDGGRLARLGLTPQVVILVVALALLPSLTALFLRWMGVAGIWTASAVFLDPRFHTLIEWTGAVVALVAGIFAHGRWKLDSESELLSLALALALPVVALLDGIHALVPWLVVESREAFVTSLTWYASRGFLSLTLFIGLGLAWATGPRHGPLAWRRLGLAIAACLAFLLAGAFSARDPGMGDALLVWRPIELGPLFLFLVAGCLWAPAVVDRRSSGLARSLLLSTVPQVACQLEMMLGSLVIGHWAKLLAYGVILGGAVVDYRSAHRARHSAWSDRESVEQELRARTAELERLDLQRLLQEEKRREAEETLRMLAKAVETMSLGVTITDMDGRIIYVNPADARVHGYTVRELLGRDSRIYAAGESSGRSDDAFEPWARERINRTKGGETFPVRLVSDRVRDENGRAVATVTICEDIRERIRIREALERRDRVLEAVAFAAESFLSKDAWEQSVGEVLRRLGKATGVEQVFLDLVNEAYPFGIDDVTYAWPPEEAVQSRESTAPGSEPAVRPHRLELPERWEQVLRRGDTLYGRVSDLPREEQEQLLRRGVRSFALVPLFVQEQWQGYLCLEATQADRDWSHVVLEGLETAARTFGASIQRRRYQEALAASEAKYRVLLEGANDLVQSVSPDGRFQFVNRAWKATLGYADEEVPRLTIWDVVRPAPHESRKDVLESMLTDDRGRIEATFVDRRGGEIMVEGVITCRYEDGLPVAAQGIFRDITERKQLDRMKSEFLSTVSHELRTPLTSIIASLGLLESGRLADQPERHRELLSVAHRNSLRLLKLINNLLDLQKLAARKMTFRSDTMEVLALLEEAIGSIQAYADQCHVRLRLSPVRSDLRLVGDRDRLMQVLNNLLSNAIKFSPPGEEVNVGASRSRGRVRLWVADHGPGIPDEFVTRLFEQFTQADSTKT